MNIHPVVRVLMERGPLEAKDLAAELRARGHEDAAALIRDSLCTTGTRLGPGLRFELQGEPQ